MLIHAYLICIRFMHEMLICSKSALKQHLNANVGTNREKQLLSKKSEPQN